VVERRASSRHTAEREKERKREREKERKRERERNSAIKRDRERERDRATVTDRQRQTDRRTSRRTYHKKRASIVAIVAAGVVGKEAKRPLQGIEQIVER
jgi:hypothetical protein